jgi:phosphatidylglycerol:prolipoprotein diacylglycerol transferase
VYPELFELPLVHVTIKSYGLMMVVGFLSAVWLIRVLAREITPDPQMIINAALYSLVAGLGGARLFYVVHYFDHFRHRPLAVFAIWEGGLELLGGVLLAITVIFLYLLYHGLPVRQYLDILAMALMLALVFGRIGCFLNGCCYGRPANLPWAVRFPYGSPAYRSQVAPDPARGRAGPQLKLPPEFFTPAAAGGGAVLKNYDDLTAEQKRMVDEGPYRCLPVHPSQLYASANAALACAVLWCFWWRSLRTAGKKRLFAAPGSTFAMMFILYGISRFLMEFLRDDNPFTRLDGLTISQNLGIALVVFGAVLMAVFQRMR